MSENFNEISRVQLPAVLHLTRLGYKYISYRKNKDKFDPTNNIILNEFEKKFFELNPYSDRNDFLSEYEEIKIELGFNDLGKSFFNRLQGKGNSKFKYIDWNNFENNSFLMAIEVPCNKDGNVFRPDITLFVNGMPLSYIELKTPNSIRNNTTGIKSEFNRMGDRFKNKNFRSFHNMTQIICFSDNMNYAADDGQQMQGSYYSTTSLEKPVFNSMHEERYDELKKRIGQLTDEDIDEVLNDSNKMVLKSTSEFKKNCDINTPTNRFLTSIYDKKRLWFFLRFGIAYVDSIDKNGNPTFQKQIMRYPQYFATKKISEKIDNGIKKGVIWHTQGSGKTALAFFNINYLKYKYNKKGIVPHFYFVVDRLDLANQAKNAFEKRGLRVNLITSKSELNRQESNNQDVSVVNIQKLTDETDLTDNSGYHLNTQNIYFIDEAHRSYNEKGSYLPNLYNSDRNAIKIALTGTPLISFDNKNRKNSRATTREIFGDYIHKYYYDQSIEDGYTLRLIREGIETSYKEKLNSILEDNSKLVKKHSLSKEMLYSNPNFVKPMLNYIINDFSNSRRLYGDSSIGAMIVAQSSNQAREMYKQFKQKKHNGETDMTASLILSDEENKTTREKEVLDFKNGKTDFLIVFNMLLTGFNAPRLKKLYLGRKVKAHNLLQTLTRVNRPYKGFRVGFIVDFANISKEFDKTNHAYFEELNDEYDENHVGENMENIYGSLFVSYEEIEESLKNAKKILNEYSIDNLEKFENEINETDYKKLSILSNMLKKVKDYYNISRMMSYDDLSAEIKSSNVPDLLKIVSNRMKTIRLISNENDSSSKELLELAMNGLKFNFNKISENELQMKKVDDLGKKKIKASNFLNNNWDQEDEEWVNLFNEFKRVLSEQNINNHNLDNYDVKRNELNIIIAKARKLNKKNDNLSQIFDGDIKYAKVYKRLNKNLNGDLFKNFSLIMKKSKYSIDRKASLNSNMVENNGYFSAETIAILRKISREEHIKIPVEVVKKTAKLLTKEYEKELEKSGV